MVIGECQYFARESEEDQENTVVRIICRCPYCGGQMKFTGIKYYWECENHDSWGDQCNEELRIQKGAYPHFELRHRKDINWFDRFNVAQ